MRGASLFCFFQSLDLFPEARGLKVFGAENPLGDGSFPVHDDGAGKGADHVFLDEDVAGSVYDYGILYLERKTENF